MISTGVQELFKAIIIQLKIFASEFFGKIRSTGTVLLVIAIVYTSRIMEKGKESHDRFIGVRFFRNQESVEFHLMPMFKPMNGISIKQAVFVNEFFETCEIHFFHLTFRNAPSVPSKSGAPGAESFLPVSNA